MHLLISEKAQGLNKCELFFTRIKCQCGHLVDVSLKQCQRVWPGMSKGGYIFVSQNASKFWLLKIENIRWNGGELIIAQLYCSFNDSEEMDAYLLRMCNGIVILLPSGFIFQNLMDRKIEEIRTQTTFEGGKLGGK